MKITHNNTTTKPSCDYSCPKDLIIQGRIQHINAEQAYYLLNKVLYKIASRFRKPTDEDFEDVFQVACSALLVTFEKYDVSQGFHFTTLLWRVAYGLIIDYVRKYNKYYQCNVYTNSTKATIFDYIIDEELTAEDKILEYTHRQEVTRRIREGLSIACKTPVDKAIIVGLYHECQTQTALSKQLGVTQVFVSRRNKALLKSYRKYLMSTVDYQEYASV